MKRYKNFLFGIVRAKDGDYVKYSDYIDEINANKTTHKRQKELLNDAFETIKKHEEIIDEYKKMEDANERLIESIENNLNWYRRENRRIKKENKDWESGFKFLVLMNISIVIGIIITEYLV